MDSESTTTPRAPEDVASGSEWSLRKRLLFRFGFVYFLLYLLPFPVSKIAVLQSFPAPFRWVGWPAGKLTEWQMEGVQTAAVWFGTHIVGVPAEKIVIQVTGSGDTMIAYVTSLMYLVVSVGVAVVWTLAARGRPVHPRLVGAYYVYVRYALAAIMLGYGLAKIPPMQFQPPGPNRLIRTFGESSPMGLLWTFMGFSPAYTMFAGAMEAVGAVLLLWRRTTTLGAVVLTGVLLNVVMLNFCYDVPVKLFSMHLLVAAIVIVMPTLPRLLCVTILHRPTEPGVLWRPFASKWKNRSLVVAKAVFVTILLGTGLWGAYRGWEQYGFTRPKPALYGLYEVKSFDVNGQARPPLLTDTSRWRRVVFTDWGSAMVHTTSDAVERVVFTHDAAARTLKLQTLGPGAQDFLLTCVAAADGGLVLDGAYKDGPVHIVLSRVPESSFRLMSRGFHWIQEFPFNR